MKDKVFFNENVNLFETHNFTHELQDVHSPRLFREMFPYDEIPRILFNFTHVPMRCPEEIWMTDTTFRDGQQATAPLTVEQIVHLFKLISKLGGPKGLVRQSEFFIYSEKDKEAVKRCQDLGFRYPEITTWIRANAKDFQLIREMNVEETGILVSCSDYHIFKKMNMTRKQAIDKYLGIVKDAISAGIKPRCHFEDVTRADYYGFVVPFAARLKDLMNESGVPIKIRCCDTMGLGVSFPGAAMPRSVPGIIYGLNHYAEFPSNLLEWHGHNDFYKVVTNSTTAWLYGASAVNCSLLGIGERTGNCPLEAMAIEYVSLRGKTDGMDLSMITEIAEYYKNDIGYKIPPRTPFVGRLFNVTRAGIHADGLLKDQEIYNIFDTQTILNRPPLVVIDSYSGLAGIAFWLNSYFNLKGEHEINKTDSVVSKIYEAIQSLYSEGRITSMSDDEIVAIFDRIDSKRLRKYLTRKL